MKRLGHDHPTKPIPIHLAIAAVLMVAAIGALVYLLSGGTAR